MALLKSDQWKDIEMNDNLAGARHVANSGYSVLVDLCNPSREGYASPHYRQSCMLIQYVLAEALLYTDDCNVVVPRSLLDIHDLN